MTCPDRRKTPCRTDVHIIVVGFLLSLTTAARARMIRTASVYMETGSDDYGPYARGDRQGRSCTAAVDVAICVYYTYIHT